eukprot:15454236-Alexandrium_andersonii.AAC.1
MGRDVGTDFVAIALAWRYFSPDPRPLNAVSMDMQSACTIAGAATDPSKGTVRDEEELVVFQEPERREGWRQIDIAGIVNRALGGRHRQEIAAPPAAEQHGEPGEPPAKGVDESYVVAERKPSSSKP